MKPVSHRARARTSTHVYVRARARCETVFIRHFCFGWNFPLMGDILGVFGEFGLLDFFALCCVTKRKAYSRRMVLTPYARLRA
jgi:hypothetical protein